MTRLSLYRTESGGEEFGLRDGAYVYLSFNTFTELNILFPVYTNGTKASGPASPARGPCPPDVDGVA